MTFRWWPRPTIPGEGAVDRYRGRAAPIRKPAAMLQPRDGLLSQPTAYRHDRRIVESSPVVACSGSAGGVVTGAVSASAPRSPSPVAPVTRAGCPGVQSAFPGYAEVSAMQRTWLIAALAGLSFPPWPAVNIDDATLERLRAEGVPVVDIRTAPSGSRPASCRAPAHLS